MLSKKGDGIMAKKSNEIEIRVAEVVDYLRITGQFAPALREVVRRKVSADAARKNGIKVTTKQLQKAADAFRVVHGLNKASDTENWLESNGVSIEVFEEYLETNLLISKFKDRLNKKAGKTKYLSSPEIKQRLKEMVYRDWVKNELK